MEICETGAFEVCKSSAVQSTASACLPAVQQSTNVVQPFIFSAALIHGGKTDSSDFCASETHLNTKMQSFGTPKSFSHQCSISDGKISQTWLPGRSWINRNPPDVRWHSPIEFKSFFREECEDIVNQLRCKATDGKSASKRKLDVSLIDEEPPPFFSTPLHMHNEIYSSSKRRRIDAIGSKRNLEPYFQHSKTSPCGSLILTNAEKSEKKMSSLHAEQDTNMLREHYLNAKPLIFSECNKSWVMVAPKPANRSMADPPIMTLSERVDNAETPTSERYKYFTSPMLPSTKLRKKLTPVKEVLSEVKISEWRNKDELNVTYVMPTICHTLDGPNSRPGDDWSFNSFLSAECENLIKQVKNTFEGIRTDRELDHKMEKSSFLEGSLLDLDKMNLNLLDFHLMDEGNQNDKHKVLCCPATTYLNKLHIKMNETESINQVGVDGKSLSTDSALPVTDSSENDRTFILSVVPIQNCGKALEEGMGDTCMHKVNSTVCMQHTMFTQSAVNSADTTHILLCDAIPEGNTMQAIVSSDKMPMPTLANITQNITANTEIDVAGVPQDMASIPNEMDVANVIHNIVMKSSGTAEANVTQELVYKTSETATNATQDLVSEPSEMTVTNATEVFAQKPNGTSVSVTQDIVLEPTEMTVTDATQAYVLKSNGTSVSNVSQDTASCGMTLTTTTQDIVLEPTEMTVTKAPQIYILKSDWSSVSNVTQDNVSAPSGMIVNVSQDLMSEPSGMTVICANQGLVSESSGMPVTNATHLMVEPSRMTVAHANKVFVQKPSGTSMSNVTQDIVSKEVTVVNTTKDIGEITTDVPSLEKDAVGKIPNITPDALLDYEGTSKCTLHKLLNKTFSMNRQDKQTLPFIVPVAIATPDFPTHCEMATVNITKDLASEHVEVAEPDSTQDVDEERLEQVVSHPEQLEHYTKIWETSQDLSFSSGSLSFVTSTPVTGLSHYRFIIKSEQPMQYDPNFTFTNLEAQTKELEMKGQSKLKLLHRGSLVKRGMTRGPMLPRVSRSNLPVAVEKSKLMEPPCAPKFGQGSLPQATEWAKKLTKEHLSNNDLPGGSNCFRRGMVCPSLSRITTVGIAQKKLGESARQLVYHKPINGLYTLKTTAAKVSNKRFLSTSFFVYDSFSI
ncbi:Hypothetical predicted protein [Pelobates cultripes]|uniref:Uncharacterized protein n=1 Tax=Pelobates cultripes TaxID=61616 RepID=A0AAD1SZW8_PELCU|nr:Hypothetical predicted protein [Pelobates cultripes]